MYILYTGFLKTAACINRSSQFNFTSVRQIFLLFSYVYAVVIPLLKVLRLYMNYFNIKNINFI